MKKAILIVACCLLLNGCRSNLNFSMDTTLHSREQNEEQEDRKSDA